MDPKKNRNDEEENDRPQTSFLSPLDAQFVATYDGWKNSDTAEETSVSESEAREAAEAAAGDDDTTN